MSMMMTMMMMTIKRSKALIYSMDLPVHERRHWELSSPWSWRRAPDQRWTPAAETDSQIQAPSCPCQTALSSCCHPQQTTTNVTHARMRARARARLTALCPGLPRWAGTIKVKPIWIFLKQETVSGSGIRWAICKSAPRSRQITTLAPNSSVF